MEDRRQAVPFVGRWLQPPCRSALSLRCRLRRERKCERRAETWAAESEGPSLGNARCYFQQSRKPAQSVPSWVRVQPLGSTCRGHCGVQLCSCACHGLPVSRLCFCVTSRRGCWLPHCSPFHRFNCITASPQTMSVQVTTCNLSQFVRRSSWKQRGVQNAA